MPTTASTPRLIERFDLFVRGDAAGSGQASRGRAADGFDRRHVRSLHQAFAIDVRVEKLADEWLEAPRGLGRGQCESRSPAVDHDEALSAVHGRNQLVDSDGAAHVFRHGEVDASGA